MSLPVNIEKLLDGNIIENERLECKEGWNPEKILHTICAFANDIENSGGGYIIIGISDNDGNIGDVLGLNREEIPKIESELFRICNFIEPHYIPSFSVETYHDRTIAVIWAPSDSKRPFKCPVKLNNRGDSERAYYVRKMSHTVKATHEEEIRLISTFKQVTFDDEINLQADVSDIDISLVKNYLVKVGSALAEEKDEKTILESMRLISGPSESKKPLNIGLLMFNMDPEQFFPYAHIDVVYKPDPTGQGMIENRFIGPIDLQLKLALDYIRGFVIREKIFKLADKAEALRVFNFPYDAIEEILVNAVYHKSYQIPEPVTVTYTGDSLEILSIPGPDPSITDRDMADFKMRSWTYRNKRLGDYLKELKLAESRNTGIPKIISSLKKNGSPPPIYETNPDRNYLRVTLKAHELFNEDISKKDVPSVNARRRTRDQIKTDIVKAVSSGGCMTTKEISSALGYSNITNALRECIIELVNGGVLTYLYPENPTDPRQRICLVK